MRQISKISIILLILSSAASVFAQRHIATAPPPEPKLELIESKDPTAAFAKNGLPEAFIIGKNRSDKLAEWLAKEISKYDEQSLPMVTAALQKVGFYIIDQNQKILYKPTSTYDMEMAFYDFEVVGMLKTSARGTTTTIKKLAEVISQNNSQISADKLGALILKDLQTAKNSKDMRIRFAANLIFELGKNSNKPIDLSAATPETSRINIIQASLIERMLLGDLMDSYGKLVAGNYRKGSFLRSDEIRFINASFLNTNSLCDSFDDLTTLQNTGKNAYQFAEKIPVFAATLDECELLGDKKAIDDCKARKAGGSNNASRRQFLENFGKGLRLVVISMASSKLKSASQRVKIDLKVTEPMPLVRTKSAANMGESRDVSAKFTLEWTDLAKAAQVGCLDNLAAGSSPKFDLLESPSMEGKTIKWGIVSEDAADQGDDSVTLSSQSDKLTGLVGESLVSIVGKPQPEDLTNRKVYATPHVVYVDVIVRENNATLGSQTVRVPIRDWIPCTDDWSGTIKYKRDYSKSFVVKSTRQSNGNGTGDGIRKVYIYENAAIRLNPRKPEEMKTKPLNPAEISIDAEYRDITTGERENDPCCGKTEGSFNTKFTTGMQEYHRKTYKRNFYVNFSGSARDFGLGFGSDLRMINTTQYPVNEVSNTNCSLEEEADEELVPITPIIPSEDEELAPLGKVGRRVLDLSLEEGRYGQRFVGTAGEVLFGSKELNLPDGSKVTWSWNLYRCRD